MATLRELIVKISANSASFQSEISRASRMGSDYYKTMEQGGRRAAQASRQSQQALEELNGQLSSARDTALGFAGVFAGAFATGHLIELADEWNAVNARLKQSSKSTDDFTRSQAALMAISQRTGTAFGDNANLFARSAASMREFGYSSSDVLKITEALATGLKLSGAGSSESSSVITQFSQALAQGVLRGEEFNAVNESGDRVIRALAAGMGVARKDLKAMADQGQLTADKVVPALISQLGQLRTEFASLPDSVSGSVTKVENAFQQWVGGMNDTHGATAALSGVLDSTAANMDNVATAAGVLVTVGVARFFGGMVSGAASATAGMVAATKSEVALAAAQVRGTQISTARARAAVYRAQQALASSKSAEVQAAQEDRVAAAQARVTTSQTRLTAVLTSGTAAEKVRARSALDRAQSALVAAKGADAQAMAERRLAAAQTVLTRNTAARTAAQANLNSVTSIGSRLLSGALGIVGGIPGLVMLGAALWYTIYQNQEQARKSALEYAKTLGDIKSKLSTMSLSEVADTSGKIRTSLKVQTDQIEDQQKKVDNLRKAIAFYQKQIQNPMQGVNTSDLQSGIESMVANLAAEEDRLRHLRDDQGKTLTALNLSEQQRIDLIRQQAADENKLYQSAIKMNGTYSEFNRLMSIGNDILAQRSGFASIPFPVAQQPVNNKQQEALNQAARNRELSTLSGEARARKQAEFSADDLGLTDDPQYQTARQKYLTDTVQAWKNQDQLKESTAAASKATQAAAASARQAETVQKSYQQKVADLNKEIQIEQVRMEKGDAAAASFSASLETGAKWTATQRAELETLNKTLTEAKQRWEDHNAAIASDPYRQASETRRRAEEQLQRQSAVGEIKTAEELARRKQDIQSGYLSALAEANQRYAVSGNNELAGNVDGIQNVENQLAKRRALIETYATAEVISQQRKNELILAAESGANEQRYQAAIELYRGQSKYNALAMDLIEATRERTTNMLTGLLTRTQTFSEAMSNLFSSLTQAVIQNLVDMAAQALVTNTILNSIMSMGSGVVGSLAGAAGSAAVGSSGAGAMGMDAGWQSYVANANGGVYASPSLSAYSSSVVDTPTFFAFAKGAGLMGEAGPEAIMPLTRTSSGALGVRAVSGGGSQSVTGNNAAPQFHISITDNGMATQSPAGMESFGAEFGQAVWQLYQKYRDKDLRQGGVLTRAINGGRS